MISYFPHYRVEPETLLSDHPIFEDVAEVDKYQQSDKKYDKCNDITQEKFMRVFQVGFRFFFKHGARNEHYHEKMQR